MSEKASGNSQSNASIENFKAKQEAELAKARSEEAQLEQIFGDSLIGDSLEDKKRVQEGTEYYSRLEDMSNREDDFSYTPEIVDELKENEVSEAIDQVPRLKALDSIAEKISNLQEDSVLASYAEKAEIDSNLDRFKSEFLNRYNRYSDKLGFDSGSEKTKTESRTGGDGDEHVRSMFEYYNERGLIDESLRRIFDKVGMEYSLDMASNRLDAVVQDQGVDIVDDAETERRKVGGDLVNALGALALDGLRTMAQVARDGSEQDDKDFVEAYDAFCDTYSDVLDDESYKSLEDILDIAYGSEKAESSPKEESSPVVEATEASELSTEDIQKRIDSLMKFATDINALKSNEKSYSDNRKILEVHIKSILDYCLEEYNSKTISLDRYNEFVKSTHQLRLVAEGKAETIDSSQDSSDEAGSNAETEKDKDNRSTRPIELDQTIFDDFIIPDSLEHSQGENGESFNSTIENNVELKDLSDIVDGYEKRKFLNQSEYDRAINTYHGKRSEILSKLDKLSRINPNVAAEKDDIIAALDQIDSRFAEIDPELPETKNLMEKISSGISQKFSKLVERVNQRNETDIPKELPKPPRMSGESSREYYKRLKKSNVSTFMALVAVSRS